MALIVLRFRDIEVRHGETIKRHRRIASDHGYCWWGWLCRDHERNPYKELLALDKAMERDGGVYPVALYDTNEGRVYRAGCSGLEAASDEIRSPEVDLTPSYYHDRHARAWFKFHEIEPAHESLVVGRTCVQMPSATDECFTDLLGQRVNRLRDLRRQEVTLWVLE